MQNTKKILVLKKKTQFLVVGKQNEATGFFSKNQKFEYT